MASWQTHRDYHRKGFRAFHLFAKFIDDRQHYPPDRLKTILGINTTCKQSPFAELDALYQEILKPTNADREGGTLRIIGLLLYVTDEKATSPPLVQHLLNLPPGRLESLLYDVHTIIDSPYDLNDVGNPIWITHASLIDFIVDARNQETTSWTQRMWMPTLHKCAFVSYLLVPVLKAPVEVSSLLVSPDIDFQNICPAEVCQYALNSWYTHLQEAAPTPGLLDFFTQCASAEIMLVRMDKLQNNMCHWLGKPDVQALMLLWLKKHVRLPLIVLYSSDIHLVA